jgi:hypothetical protein
MKSEIGLLVEKYFSFLKTDLGFAITNEESLGADYRVEFSSPDVVIKIEKYRRELYCYVSKFGDPDSEAHLFNLLKYLHRGVLPEDSLHYFSNIEDVTESFRLQVELISQKIKENYSAIKIFFGPDYRNNILGLNSYLIQQNPQLFKTKS